MMQSEHEHVTAPSEDDTNLDDAVQDGTEVVLMEFNVLAACFCLYSKCVDVSYYIIVILQLSSIYFNYLYSY